MNKLRRTHGAVSVFLVMILVPCIVVTSVFVDLGRVHMSKSMANSASDLALNSLMTNYDADLNEWYGMVASCQSIEEFYEISAQFFLRTISSQGLSDDEIILLSDYYANATNDDTIYDLLQIECQTDSSSMITAVDGANLSNATFIKDQVVEFMKYRAPIEITTGIIDRLNNDSSTSDALEAEENEQLVNDKIDYYEAEGELLAAAFNSYVAIYDYYKAAVSNNLTNDKLIGYADKLTTYKNVYSDIHKLMVANLFNTSGLSVYTRITLPLDKFNTAYTETSSEVYSRKEIIDGSEYYYIDGSKITNLLDNLETEISDFNTARSNFETASSNLMNNLPGSGNNQAYEIQWWVQMNRVVNASSGVNYTKEIESAGNDMLAAYSKVLAIEKCELGEDLPDDWQSRFSILTNEVKTLQEKYLQAGITDISDQYLKTVKKLEEISDSNQNNVKSSTLTVTVDGQTKTIDEAISYINTDLNAIRNELQNYVDLLDIAIDGNWYDFSVPKNDRVKSLDALLDLVDTYNSSLLTWTNTANNTDTKMAEKDRAEIVNIQSICKNITREEVGILKTRLINIRSQFNNIIPAIDSMKYGNTKLINIDNYNRFKTAASSRVSASEIGLTNQELNAYANSTFSQLFVPDSSTILTLGNTNDANYNPQINPIDGEVQTPKLFIYFQDKFGGLSKQEVDKKRDELDDGKDTGNKKVNEALEKGRYHGRGSEITKDFSGTGTFNLADGAISGIVDLFDSLINLDISNIRDDLYVTTYIMNMFSYATYENEGLYSLVQDKTELTLVNYPTKYGEASVMGKTADDEGTWLSSLPKDSYNKSLTNKLINKTNNAAYCAEVEYILYGGRDGKGNSDNVKSVYSNIYGIRYTLNLVSGFRNFWSMTYPSDTNNTTAAAIYLVASGIQSITGGIIPIPVTEVILIPILTAFETANDLERLEAGFPVELYKSEYTDWWIRVPAIDQLSGFLSGVDNNILPNNQDKGLFYSDYLTVFVFLGLKGSSAEDMYQRMAEVIQANIRKLSGVNDYSMKKSQIYFKLDAQIRVKPLMITLPFFNDYDNNMDTKTDWCTYNISTMRGYS